MRGRGETSWCGRAWRPQPPGTIMDTLWIRKDTTSIIRMKFREWTGKSVFHCHILPHEDTGMMKNFLIQG